MTQSAVNRLTDQPFKASLQCRQAKSIICRAASQLHMLLRVLSCFPVPLPLHNCALRGTEHAQQHVTNLRQSCCINSSSNIWVGARLSRGRDETRLNQTKNCATGPAGRKQQMHL